MTQPSLTELLCARLCHDLSGPVGAAAAGAELIEELGGPADADTLNLVAVSAQAAAARLKFFRACLGPAPSAAQAPAALRDLTQAYLDSQASGPSQAVMLDWRLPGPSIAPDLARLVLNLVVMAKDSLPRGGRILVAPAGAGFEVVAEGTPATLPDEAAGVLCQAGEPATPRAAHARFIQDGAATAGRTVTVDSQPGRVVLTLGAQGVSASRG